MAATAGSRNMRVIHRRIRSAPSEYLVGSSVAVLAIGGNFTSRGDLRMRTMRVCVLRVGVAIDTEDLLGRSFMRKALYVLVAINAAKLHGAVDRVLELLRIYIERDWLAVHVGG